MDAGQNDMGGHGADDMGLVREVGGEGVGRTAVGFDSSARGDVGGDEAMQRGGGEVLDRGQAKASGRVVLDLDGAGDNILPGASGAAPQTGSVLVRNGISVSSTSTRPASGARPARPWRGAAWRTAATRTCRNRAELLLQLQRRNPIRMGGHGIGGQNHAIKGSFEPCMIVPAWPRYSPQAAHSKVKGFPRCGHPLARRMPDIETRGPAGCDKPGGAGVVVGKLALELDQRGGKIGHR